MNRDEAMKDLRKRQLSPIQLNVAELLALQSAVVTILSCRPPSAKLTPFERMAQRDLEAAYERLGQALSADRDAQLEELRQKEAS